MNPMRMLPGFAPSSDGRNTTILDDLHSGRAGFFVRLGLSLASAPILIAGFMFVLAVIEMAGGDVDEEHVAVAIGVSGAIWCGVLIWVWSGYRRFARIIKSVFAVLGTWIVAVPACFFIAESSFRGDAEELLIAGIILTAISVTFFIVTTAVYQSIGGKPLKDKVGDLRVQCPTCGYSMVGLDSCRCPECGGNFTIDEIIVAQDYEALRPHTHVDIHAGEVVSNVKQAIVERLPRKTLQANDDRENTPSATSSPPTEPSSPSQQAHPSGHPGPNPETA